LFPKFGDSLDGANYRNQLITVPSCDAHNAATARDDEYLVYTLAMGLTTNELGKHQFLTKIMRAIERRPGLMKTLLGTMQQVSVFDRVTKRWDRTIAFKPDESRLLRTFEKIARGLWFHEKQIIWTGTVSVLTEYMLSLEDVEGNRMTQQLVKSLDSLLSAVPHKGANPTIFSYQMATYDGDSLIRLHFYEHTRVTCILRRAAD
jgi:hypothetical protein